MAPTLLDPITIGELHLPHRMVMSPLTRNRSTMPGRVPNALMREYYVQRASAAMILTEATSVSSQGVGYPATPGIWSDEQVEGWRSIVEAVHHAGGRILLQLWHVGRISDPSYHGGEPPVAPSAIAPSGNPSLLRPKRPYAVPRALATGEIAGVVESYRLGAANAKRAGFDGVEIHGANGYLLDQFLQDRTNQRTDQYGGSIENRARLMLEVADAVVSVWGPGRVGMHLAPRCDAHDMGDSNPPATFGHVVRELSKRKLAFIMARESATGTPRIGPELRRQFSGAWVANEGFTPETGAMGLEEGVADAVSFGKLFISNPDLPERVRRGLPLAPWNDRTFYAEGPVGYTDYPRAT
ncbi:MAG TPA: alkene reductase [Myxococcaceae bacterium]|jgi:hypothetical protein